MGSLDALAAEAERSAAAQAAERLEEAEAPVSVTPWPDPLAEEAFHGPIGDLVRLIEPHTEADPAALLVQALVAAGNALGRAPHMMMDGARHGCNLFAGIVGVSSKGRKGTSWARIRGPLEASADGWGSRIMSGLSSGEGLIWAVRDKIERQDAIKDHGHVAGYETVEIDPGVTDKRLLVVESELAGVLKIMARDGNSLSATIRDAFDHGSLRTLTKNSPAVATDAHVSIIGHTTKDELTRYLGATEAANGFANRFLWVCARRSKVLPYGGAIADADFAPVVRALTTAFLRAPDLGEMTHSPATREAWCRVYPALSDARPGLLGNVTNRAEALVLRVALVYAAMDGTATVSPAHLRAALAVWDYCFRSSAFIFGEAMGDPVADGILAGLRSAADGLTRTELSALFSGNTSSARIAKALGALAGMGMVERDAAKAATTGRAAERWRATKETKETKDQAAVGVGDHSP